MRRASNYELYGHDFRGTEYLLKRLFVHDSSTKWTLIAPAWNKVIKNSQMTPPIENHLQIVWI